MTTFTDSDWAGCVRSAKSTSGGAVCIGDHVIKTYCKQQKVIALSSAEAERALLRQRSGTGHLPESRSRKGPPSPHSGDQVTFRPIPFEGRGRRTPVRGSHLLSREGSSLYMLEEVIENDGVGDEKGDGIFEFDSAQKAS